MFKRKSVLLLLMTALIFAGTLSSVSMKPVWGANATQGKGIRVIVDGNELQLNNQPQVIHGHLMLPVHPIAEAMGWSVDINQWAIYLGNHGDIELITGEMYYTYYQSVISLTKRDTNIHHYDTLGGINTYHFCFQHYPAVSDEICPGSIPCWKLNETDMTSMTTMPISVNDETFVEMNDLAEALYAGIKWDRQNKIVTITSKTLPYFDGNGLPAEYREALLKKTLSEYQDYINEKQANVLTSTTGSRPYDIKLFEAEVIRLTNEIRMKEGLDPVETTPALDNAADIRGKEIAVDFGHIRPDGTDCFSIFEECGLDLSYNGENIELNSVGIDAEETAAAFVNMWFHSPGHKANLLRPETRYIGVSGEFGQKERLYCVQIFAK